MNPVTAGDVETIVVDGRQSIRIERADEKSLVVTSMRLHTLVRTVERAGRVGN